MQPRNVKLVLLYNNANPNATLRILYQSKWVNLNNTEHKNGTNLKGWTGFCCYF